MQKSIIIAILVAVGGGLAVGIQSTLNSSAGKLTGATLTGLFVNFLGGMAAGVILLIVLLRKGTSAFAAIQIPTLGIMLIAGLLGIVVITSIAYALPKTGVAAGLAAIIAGQMVVALIVDTFGLAGSQVIPLSWTRIAGIVLLALGTWALLAKK